jgi:hypothetical protein
MEDLKLQKNKHAEFVKELVSFLQRSCKITKMIYRVRYMLNILFIYMFSLLTLSNVTVLRENGATSTTYQ